MKAGTDRDGVQDGHLEGEEGEGVFYHQARQPIGEEDKIVSLRLPIPADTNTYASLQLEPSRPLT